MKQDRDQQLNDLKQYYLSKLPDKITAIELGWQEYLVKPDVEKLLVLYRQTHNMSGSAGTYGYKELSDIAKKIDKILRAQSNIDSENKDKITALIAELKAVGDKMKSRR